MSTMRNLTASNPVTGLVQADSGIGASLPFPTSFNFLGLPSEIRLKIYRFLFRSHLPVYPTIPSKDTTGSCRGVLKRTSFPTTLLLTNRQIYTEASSVLWGDNRIIIQFPLNWNREREHCSLSRAQGRTQPHWFEQCETWMPSLYHLQQIQHLVIEVYLFRCTASTTPAHLPEEPAAIVRQEIQNFCNLLSKGHHIRRLEIRFTNALSSYNPNELLVSWSPYPVKHYSDAGGKLNLPWTNIPAIGCCSRFGDTAFGRKDIGVGELEALCRQSIDVDQQVLEPLAKLRGISDAETVGRVSQDWAEFLKICLQSSPGTNNRFFNHRTRVYWD